MTTYSTTSTILTWVCLPVLLRTRFSFLSSLAEAPTFLLLVHILHPEHRRLWVAKWPALISRPPPNAVCFVGRTPRPARAGKYRPPKIQILLTKCDLVKRIDLARRVAFVRQQLDEVGRAPG